MWVKNLHRAKERKDVQGYFALSSSLVGLLGQLWVPGSHDLNNRKWSLINRLARYSQPWVQELSETRLLHNTLKSYRWTGSRLQLAARTPSARICIRSSDLYQVPDTNFVELIKRQTINITSKYNSGYVNKVLWTKIQSRK